MHIAHHKLIIDYSLLMHSPRLGEKLPPSWHIPYLVTNIGLRLDSESFIRCLRHKGASSCEEVQGCMREQRRCFCVPTTCEPRKFIFSITASRVLISLSHMSVATFQPAVMESQNNIHTSHHLIKFGTYPKLTIKMTLQATTNH